jgi:hypothetical protein
VGVGVGSSHDEHCRPIAVSTQIGQLSLSIVMFVHVPVVVMVVVIPSCGVQYSDAADTIPDITKIASINMIIPLSHIDEAV